MFSQEKNMEFLKENLDNEKRKCNFLDSNTFFFFPHFAHGLKLLYNRKSVQIPWDFHGQKSVNSILFASKDTNQVGKMF